MERFGKRNLVLGLCLALAAGSAANAGFRAPDDDDEIGGDFKQPVAKSGDGDTNVVVVDNGTTFSARIQGGKVKSVQKDGKDLSKDQYRIKNGQIQFLDSTGAVERSIPIPKAGSLRQPFAISRGLAPAAPVPPAVPGQRMPRVMLGVTMVDADPDFMEELGVPDEQGVMLNSVTKGLPADKAGLKARDVVIAIDGNKLSGEESLRAALAKKNPGDEITVKVLRKGGPQEIKVTLEPYSQARIIERSIKNDSFSGFDQQQLDEILKEVEEQVREQLQALKSQVDAADWNKVKDQVSAALAESMKQLAVAREQAASGAAEGMKWWQEHGQELTAPNGNWMRLVVPAPTPAPAPAQEAQVDNKLDKLSEQLDRLNKRLDEMEKQIQKK